MNRSSSRPRRKCAGRYGQLQNDNQVRQYIIKLIILLAILPTASFGQTIQRLKTETVDQFVTRLKPDSSVLTHKVIQTNWNSKSAIIAFYDQTYKLPVKNDPDQQDYHRVVATIFIQADSSHYNKFLIDNFDSEGGDPNIETIFFANADKDPEKEIIIIVSWEQRHYDVDGTLYGTFIFDNLLTNPQMKLYFLKDVSKKLDGGCECSWRDGETKKSKFKTAADIKAELLKLGYK